MNEQKYFTIKQLQYITGWSYPTALAFATKNGLQSGGIWLIPINMVQAIVDGELDKAIAKKSRYYDTVSLAI